MEILPILEKCEKTAIKLDALLFKKRTSSLLLWQYEKQEKKALKDEHYQEIEKRRETFSGHKVFLSDDLTLADFEMQQRIKEEVAPDPFWLKSVQKIDRFSFARTFTKASTFIERGVRGWSKTDVWDFSGYHQRVLGEMLLELARTSQGYPSGFSQQSWQAVLEKNGQALLKETLEEDDAYYAYISTPGRKREDYASIFKAQQEEDVKKAEKVKAALLWVAENHDSLWD